MTQEERYLLITRYLARQTSSEENEWLATWVAQAPENERTFEQLKTIWQNSQTPPAPAETAAALQRLKARLTLPTEQPEPAEQTEPAPSALHRKTTPYWLLAGVLLVLAAVGLGILFYPTHSGPSAYQLRRTVAGQRQTLRLPDGSRVTLAPQSQLRYPAVFDGRYRDVYLEGEAFFAVSKDAHRPFRVHSGSWTTQVLGTKFNVSAFPQAAQMAVSLVEGRVQVLDKQNRYLLAPGQQLLTDHATGRIYRQPFDSARVTGWRSNKLVFRNEKLADAAGQLERFYGVKLVFADSATAEVRLWATFHNEPLSAVLEALELAGPIAYRREGHTIYLQRQPTPTRN